MLLVKLFVKLLLDFIILYFLFNSLPALLIYSMLLNPRHPNGLQDFHEFGFTLQVQLNSTLAHM